MHTGSTHTLICVSSLSNVLFIMQKLVIHSDKKCITVHSLTVLLITSLLSGVTTSFVDFTTKDRIYKNNILMSLFDDFIFYFLNNNFKLCTKRFGQQQPVLCLISHIRFSQWLHTQLQDSKTSERSWTGDHDTKWWWLMFSITSLVFFPPKSTSSS